MSYKIVNRFLTGAALSRKAPYSMNPIGVTIHNTYNDATAINEISFMSGNNSVVGYHVAIDDIHAVQAIPFSRNAFHAGDGGTGTGNRRTIGIEICYSKSGGPKYYKAEENATVYTAHVLKQYGWDIDKIYWHRDWSGKNCPHRMIDEGRLNSFKQRVQKELNKLNGATKPVEPKPEKPEEKDDLTMYMDEKLPVTQQNDAADLFKKAYQLGYFGTDHSSKVKDMTRRQYFDLKESLEIREKLGKKVK